MTILLRDPVSAVRGVGKRWARALDEAGIRLVVDLLWQLPRRWEDRCNPVPVGSISGPSPAVTVNGRLVGLRVIRGRWARGGIVEGTVEDDSGSLNAVWFNQPYLARTFRDSPVLWLHGAVREGRHGGLQLIAPEWELEEADEAPLHHGRIVPVYRRIGALAGRRLRALIHGALDDIGPADDGLLAEIGEESSGMMLSEAFREVHFPVPAGLEAGDSRLLIAELEARRTAAQRRLALHELCGLALRFEKERQVRCARGAPRCTASATMLRRVRSVLPFSLTNEQRRVVDEILDDLKRPVPMARLLQGDVGSGKTVVAAIASLVAMESGLQVAFLAPTEMLARQHLETLQRLLGPAGYPIRFLGGSLPAAARREVISALGQAPAGIVVGTHVLIQDTVSFARLGLVIVDEQHRFGTAQRQRLVEKGSDLHPHLLVMTATPIPRSLALAHYGDLDTSVLGGAPPGRAQVRTVIRSDDSRSRLFEFIRKEAGDGGQVFWVVPLVENSDRIEARALVTHLEALRDALPGLRVEAVHGRQDASVREKVMQGFSRGEVAVLCATTVVEVGIDVPAATVMVVENAERFGLAQLHQLRGRVGRGSRRSYCVLLAGPEASEAALRRLDVLVSTSDGFQIAEEDFRFRGPGEIAGLRQWGRGQFRVADFDIHRGELDLARRLAGRAAAQGRLDSLMLAVPPVDPAGREGVVLS